MFPLVDKINVISSIMIILQLNVSYILFMYFVHTFLFIYNNKQLTYLTSEEVHWKQDSNDETVFQK